MAIGFRIASGEAGMAAGKRIDPYQASNFLVEIEGIAIGSFSECSGLQVETEYFEYREGGRNDYLHRFAGPTKYPPLLLKHGITRIDGLWNWHQDVTNGIIHRRNGTIYLLDKRQTAVMYWNFKEAFPVKYQGPDFRADSASVAFESVELSHKGLSRPGAGRRLRLIGGGMTT